MKAASSPESPCWACSFCLSWPSKAYLELDPATSRATTPAASVIFIALFYIESALIAFWGWLSRRHRRRKEPRRRQRIISLHPPAPRAWFIWNDWGFGMAQIAIIVLSNLMFGFLLEHILVLMHICRSVRTHPLRRLDSNSPASASDQLGSPALQQASSTASLIFPPSCRND